MRTATTLFICLFAAAAVATPVTVRVGVINDNYTGTAEAGRTGRYLGSDDFLTVSYLAHVERGDWSGAVVFNTVTSRRFGFRYDLLQGTAQRTVRVGPFELQPSIGLVGKGALGGDALQNSFHRLRELPEVHLPYRGSGVGAVVRVDGDWPRRSVLFEDDLLTLTAGVRLVTAHVPSRLSAQASYLAGWRRFEGELLVGYRQQLNSQPDYSELTRSGAVGAINLRLRLVSQLFFELGASALPVQNLQSDPGYQQRDPSYTPQIWMVASWQAGGRSLRAFMDY